MQREQQIDLRRQRALAGRFRITNLGKNRVYSDFAVENPDSGGRYVVSIRGFELGDNACTCPDFKANTLGTCKHIEAVLRGLRREVPVQVLKKKAVVRHAELRVHYGEEWRLHLVRPPRCSDALAGLARRFFDERGLWNDAGRYEDLLAALEPIREPVRVTAEAKELIEGEIDRRYLADCAQRWRRELAAGPLDASLLKVPLAEHELQGAVFLAGKGRSILADEDSLSRRRQALAAVELLWRERSIRRVLVVIPASGITDWVAEIRQATAREVQVLPRDSHQRGGLPVQPPFYLVATYDQVMEDADAINAWQPQVVILDEAEQLAMWPSPSSRAVKRLAGRYAMVLTRVPLEDQPGALWSIGSFVDERCLRPAWDCLREHGLAFNGGCRLNEAQREQIRQALAGVYRPPAGSEGSSERDSERLEATAGDAGSRSRLEDPARAWAGPAGVDELFLAGAELLEAAAAALRVARPAGGDGANAAGAVEHLQRAAQRLGLALSMGKVNRTPAAAENHRAAGTRPN